MQAYRLWFAAGKVWGLPITMNKLSKATNDNE